MVAEPRFIAGGSIPQERRGLMARKSDLDVEVENMKGDLVETKRSLGADVTLAAKFAESEVAEKHRDEDEADEKRNLLSAAYRISVGRRPAVGRIITGVEQKDKTGANEQQAAVAREFVIKVEDEYQKVCDGILVFMDELFIPSASAGESKMFCYVLEGDCCRYLAEFATAEDKCKVADEVVDVPVVLQRQVLVIQQVQETVEVSRVWYTDKIIDVPVAAQRQVPSIQTVQRTAGVPRVQFLDRLVGVPVATQTQVPYSSAPQERIQERTVEETDVPVPHVKEEIVEVVRQIPQEQLQGRTMEQTVAVPLPRVMEEIVKVANIGPQERVQNCTLEPLVDAPDSQIQEKNVEFIQLVPQGRNSDCIDEQITDVSAPQERVQ